MAGYVLKCKNSKEFSLDHTVYIRPRTLGTSIWGALWEAYFFPYKPNKSEVEKYMKQMNGMSSDDIELIEFERAFDLEQVEKVLES